MGAALVGRAFVNLKDTAAVGFYYRTMDGCISLTTRDLDGMAKYVIDCTIDV